MAEHYYDEFVKLSYKIEHRSHLDPTRDELVDWDDTLRRRYDRFLDEYMEDNGIDDTKRNRSILVTLSLSATGLGRTQVKRACEYWANVMGIRA